MEMSSYLSQHTPNGVSSERPNGGSAGDWAVCCIAAEWSLCSMCAVRLEKIGAMLVPANTYLP